MHLAFDLEIQASNSRTMREHIAHFAAPSWCSRCRSSNARAAPLWARCRTGALRLRQAASSRPSARAPGRRSHSVSAMNSGPDGRIIAESVANPLRRRASADHLRDVAKLREIAPDGTADHGVGIAAPQQQARQPRSIHCGPRAARAMATRRGARRARWYSSASCGMRRVGLGIERCRSRRPDRHAQAEMRQHAPDVVAAGRPGSGAPCARHELLRGLQHIGVIALGEYEALLALREARWPHP